MFGEDRSGEEIIKRINDYIFFNFLITLMLITYLPISMAGMKNLASMNFRNFANSVSGLTSLAIVPIVVLLPVFSFRYLKTNEFSLHEFHIIYQAGNLYSGMKMEQGLIKLIYNPIYLLRRFLMCFVVVALPHFPVA